LDGFNKERVDREVTNFAHLKIKKKIMQIVHNNTFIHVVFMDSRVYYTRNKNFRKKVNIYIYIKN